MKAEVSLSCFPTLFIARPAIHLQTTSQILSPAFRSTGWKMSQLYINVNPQPSTSLQALRYVFSAIDFHAVNLWPRITSAVKVEKTDIHSLAMHHWREPCALLWRLLGWFAAEIWQPQHWKKS